MNFQKLFKVISPLRSIPIAVTLVLLACNSNTSDEKVNTKNAPENETSTVEPTKPKKVKASVATRKASTEKITKDNDGVYMQAEVMPSFPGGDAAVSNYISDNISYDPNAMENDQEGTVIVSFVVDENGNVSEAKVKDEKMNIANDLEQEAIRVVKQMPKWEPGTVNGKKVKTWMHLPITFRMEE